MRGEAALVPNLAVHALREGKLSAQEWRTGMSELGATDCPLGVRAPAETSAA